MSEQGFIYDSAVCLCCHTCEVACQEAHSLPPHIYFRKVAWVNAERDGCTVSIPYSGACNHCQNPACVRACPTGAMYLSDGVVLHDDGLCISCGACMWNCPYGAVSISPFTGMTQKCDSCAERRSRGLLPVCVDACPTRALHWGDLDEAKKLPHSPELPFLPESSRTNPRLCVYTRSDHQKGGE